MNLSSQPAFKRRRQPVNLPHDTEEAKELSEQVIAKNTCDLMEYALAFMPGITEDQVTLIYSAAMNVRQNQIIFRLVSISPPAPDGVCTVKLHNTIPHMECNVYRSISEVLQGCYHIPGMFSSFPGMVASNRAFVLGDPFAQCNARILRTIKRAKIPKVEECLLEHAVNCIQ